MDTVAKLISEYPGVAIILLGSAVGLAGWLASEVIRSFQAKDQALEKALADRGKAHTDDIEKLHALLRESSQITERHIASVATRLGDQIERLASAMERNAGETSQLLNRLIERLARLEAEHAVLARHHLSGALVRCDDCETKHPQGGGD